MKSKVASTDGSTGVSSDAPKNESEAPITTVRRIAGLRPWLIPGQTLEQEPSGFFKGILRDVVFEPNAEVMKDLWCGTGNVSQSELRGVLEKDAVLEMPSDVVRHGYVRYDKERKVFHLHGEPDAVFVAADYVLLQHTGQAVACWKS